MTPLPTLRQLQYLMTLSEHQSFSKAAAALHVTQPTLSAGMRELESILDAQLVERGKRGVRLTPVGREALGRAADILDKTEALVAAVSERAKPLTGRLNVGLIPTIAPFFLPQMMFQTREAAPDLTLVVRESFSQDLVERLNMGTLDMAILALPYALGGLEHHILGADEFWLLCPPDHALANRAQISAADVSREDMLLLEDGHCLRDHVLAACPTQSGQNSGLPTAASLYTLVHLVAAGLGITLVPKMALDHGLIRGLPLVARPFKRPPPSRDIAVVWRPQAARARDAEALARALRL